MTIRVLALPRYGRKGASSRLRTLQYVPALAAEGIKVDVRSLLDDDYLGGLYSDSVSRSAVLKAYVARVLQLVTASHYDLIWTEKELLPWLPSFVERALVPRKIPLLVDYDDAVFHRYGEHQNVVVRALLGRKIERIMQRADAVSAGNQYLADHARRAGARVVERLPTVIDLGRYTYTEARDNPQVMIGWIGSPTTAKYLKMLIPAVERLQSRDDIRFLAIGAAKEQVSGTPFEAVDWTEATEVELLGRLDIGIMPLHDELWDRGKCGYKLIQYMGARLPVVASAVGANLEIVEHGVSGFLARDTDEWVASLDRLVGDGGLRRSMGIAGRRAVERGYSLQVQGPRLAALIRKLVGRAGG